MIKPRGMQKNPKPPRLKQRSWRVPSVQICFCNGGLLAVPGALAPPKNCGEPAAKKPFDLALQNDFRVLLVVHIMAELIKPGELKDRMKKVPEWELEKKQIERTFEFDDFTDAIDFVNSVAGVAEEEEHQPEIDARYKKVHLVLSTHSKGGRTELDFGLAERIDTLAE